MRCRAIKGYCTTVASARDVIASSMDPTNNLILQRFQDEIVNSVGYKSMLESSRKGRDLFGADRQNSHTNSASTFQVGRRSFWSLINPFKVAFYCSWWNLRNLANQISKTVLNSFCATFMFQSLMSLNTVEEETLAKCLILGWGGVVWTHSSYLKGERISKISIFRQSVSLEGVWTYSSYLKGGGGFWLILLFSKEKEFKKKAFFGKELIWT